MRCCHHFFTCSKNRLPHISGGGPRSWLSYPGFLLEVEGFGFRRKKRTDQIWLPQLPVNSGRRVFSTTAWDGLFRVMFSKDYQPFAFGHIHKNHLGPTKFKNTVQENNLDYIEICEWLADGKRRNGCLRQFYSGDINWKRHFKTV